MFGSVVTSKPDADGKRCVDKVIIVVYHLLFQVTSMQRWQCPIYNGALKVLSNQVCIRYQRNHVV